jgi:tetratricopeptide (TPR) repeat protein
LPYYCTSKKSSAIPTPDEILYNQASTYFKAGNYDSAQIFYDSLVINYNHSSFSKAALKDMFALEQFTGNQYGNLKTWYKTNDSILSDTSLTRLAGYLANKCDIELGNYQIAFNWFDSVIVNPYSFEDSIFAVIDRDFLSLQTGSNALKEISFNWKGIPNSYDEFKLKSNYLISLLPGELKSEAENKKNITGGKNAKILSIAPNPFKDNTQIRFEILLEGIIGLKVCDLRGRTLKTIPKSKLTPGEYSLELKLTGTENGIYLVSLVHNGVVTDTRKIRYR